MKNLCISAAFLAVFFLSGCAGVAKIDAVDDRVKNGAIDMLELLAIRLIKIYDHQLEELAQDGARLQKIGQIIGRVPHD